MSTISKEVGSGGRRMTLGVITIIPALRHRGALMMDSVAWSACS
jgi:hypothetical protein